MRSSRMGFSFSPWSCCGKTIWGLTGGVRETAHRSPERQEKASPGRYSSLTPSSPPPRRGNRGAAAPLQALPRRPSHRAGRGLSWQPLPQGGPPAPPCPYRSRNSPSQLPPLPPALVVTRPGPAEGGWRRIERAQSGLYQRPPPLTAMMGAGKRSTEPRRGVLWDGAGRAAAPPGGRRAARSVAVATAGGRWTRGGDAAILSHRPVGTGMPRGRRPCPLSPR